MGTLRPARHGGSARSAHENKHGGLFAGYCVFERRGRRRKRKGVERGGEREKTEEEEEEEENRGTKMERGDLE